MEKFHTFDVQVLNGLPRRYTNSGLATFNFLSAERDFFVAS